MDGPHPGSTGKKMPRLLLSIPDTQEALGGISRSTVYLLIARKKLDAVKMGSRILVTGESAVRLTKELPPADITDGQAAG
jgi:excisionase family DNA binding protein